jgi:hypothetical protein
LRLLDLRRLDGHRPGPPFRTGGELQTLPNPGSTELFSAPAVWHHTVFVGDSAGTAAYTLSGRRLHLLWQNSTPGTSPVVAGGVLYVYNFSAGGLNAYDPASGRRLATLPSGSGHWESPIVAGGEIALAEGGSTEDSARNGVLDTYSLG